MKVDIDEDLTAMIECVWSAENDELMLEVWEGVSLPLFLLLTFPKIFGKILLENEKGEQ
jgi:hypothetical protein